MYVLYQTLKMLHFLSQSPPRHEGFLDWLLQLLQSDLTIDCNAPSHNCMPSEPTAQTLQHSGSPLSLLLPLVPDKNKKIRATLININASCKCKRQNKKMPMETTERTNIESLLTLTQC